MSRDLCSRDRVCRALPLVRRPLRCARQPATGFADGNILTPCDRRSGIRDPAASVRQEMPDIGRQPPMSFRRVARRIPPTRQQPPHGQPPTHSQRTHHAEQDSAPGQEDSLVEMTSSAPTDRVIPTSPSTDRVIPTSPPTIHVIPTSPRGGIPLPPANSSPHGHPPARGQPPDRTRFARCKW